MVEPVIHCCISKQSSICIYPVFHCWPQIMTVLWFLPVWVLLTCLMFSLQNRHGELLLNRGSHACGHKLQQALFMKYIFLKKNQTCSWFHSSLMFKHSLHPLLLPHGFRCRFTPASQSPVYIFPAWVTFTWDSKGRSTSILCLIHHHDRGSTSSAPPSLHPHISPSLAPPHCSFFLFSSAQTSHNR